MTQLKANHLMYRAAFGPKLDSSPNSEALLAKLIAEAKANNYKDLKVTDPGIGDKIASLEKERSMEKEGDISNETRNADIRKQVVVLAAKAMAELRGAWIKEMIHSENQLGEKMALFWHNHFATSEKRAFNSQGILLDILRSNATGNFGELLRQVSKSAIMIHYLNNQQNTKKAPNENFARELMELFTLGRDNGYNEQDIKEAARCFTGWKANKMNGKMTIVKNQFDDGEKMIFGVKGNFDGDDVIDLILKKKETAQFIASKIYKYFVNPVEDSSHSNFLAEILYKNKYELLPMLEAMFSAKWFYDEKNMGAQIKSPIELMVGVYRQIPFEQEQILPVLYYTKLLGQQLFDLPNVGGWPHHKDWIDSSSLLLRLQIPNAIIAMEKLDLAVKSDDDETGGEMVNANAAKINKFVQNKVAKAKMTVDETKLGLALNNDFGIEHIGQKILVTKIRKETLNLMPQTSQANALKIVKAMMSTPEYQIC